MAKYNSYSQEQEQFLMRNSSLMSRKQLTENFNETFGCCKSVNTIKSFCNRRGYSADTDGRFKNGHQSWQTGLTKEQFRSHYSEQTYKALTQAANEKNKTHKIGDEVIIDGVPWIIISLDYSKPLWQRREPKRRFVWKQIHGEIPKDYCIINLDRDLMNCRPENLYCMPIKYRTLIAKNNWWFTDAELTKTAIKWCEFYYAIKEANYDRQRTAD